ncbi:MAG: hypothetical protein ABI690_25180 [Chloroflexota bacterium]
MPVQVVWDDEAQTILRQIYSGHLKMEDYIQGTDEFGRMARTVTHPVHSIMDRSKVISTPGIILPAMRYANNNLPPNLDLRIVVKASMFTRVIVDLGRRAAPKLANNVYFVDTVEEAHRVVAEHTEKVPAAIS